MIGFPSAPATGRGYPPAGAAARERPRGCAACCHPGAWRGGREVSHHRRVDVAVILSQCELRGVGRGWVRRGLGVDRRARTSPAPPRSQPCARTPGGEEGSGENE